jgi:hypothetical protein
MKWTTQLPTEPGRYWYCDFWNKEIPSAVLKVTECNGVLFAEGELFRFEIGGKKRTKRKLETESELWERGIKEGHGSEIEFWCRIPEPEIPK